MNAMKSAEEEKYFGCVWNDLVCIIFFEISDFKKEYSHFSWMKLDTELRPFWLEKDMKQKRGKQYGYEHFLCLDETASERI